jgi:hypothetical protein
MSRYVSYTPCLFRSVIDTCESPPSAVYTEKSRFPSGCQAISSGHLLFWDAESEELSREAPDLQNNIERRKKIRIRLYGW